jgi:hypothetical protein
MAVQRDRQTDLSIFGRPSVVEKVGLHCRRGTNELTVMIESGASRPTTVLESLVTTAPTTPSILSIMSVQHPQLKKGTKYWLVLTDTGDAVDYWFVDPNSPRGTSLQVSCSSGWISSTGSTKASALPLLW